jgi:hypothetical protein
MGAASCSFCFTVTALFLMSLLFFRVLIPQWEFSPLFVLFFHGPLLHSSLHLSVHRSTSSTLSLLSNGHLVVYSCTDSIIHNGDLLRYSCSSYSLAVSNHCSIDTSLVAHSCTSHRSSTCVTCIQWVGRFVHSLFLYSRCLSDKLFSLCTLPFTVTRITRVGLSNGRFKRSFSTCLTAWTMRWTIRSFVRTCLSILHSIECLVRCASLVLRSSSPSACKLSSILS